VSLPPLVEFTDCDNDQVAIDPLDVKLIVQNVSRDAYPDETFTRIVVASGEFIDLRDSYIETLQVVNAARKG